MENTLVQGHITLGSWLLGSFFQCSNTFCHFLFHWHVYLSYYFGVYIPSVLGVSKLAWNQWKIILCLFHNNAIFQFTVYQYTLPLLQFLMYFCITMNRLLLHYFGMLTLTYIFFDFSYQTSNLHQVWLWTAYSRYFFKMRLMNNFHFIAFIVCSSTGFFDFGLQTEVMLNILVYSSY